MIDLGQYLLSLGGLRRQAGVFDCCTLPADWAVANGFADPMAYWRGAYDSEEGARSFIDDAGGLAILFDAGMGYANIDPRHGDPIAGDIGVLIIGSEEAGAIFTGQRWAIVATRGLGFASIDPDCIIRKWAIS